MLRAYLAEHRAEYAQPARITLRHTLLAEDLVTPRPFPLGSRFQRQSAVQLAKLFGGEFAGAVFALPVGRWSEPVRSSHGNHRVYVESLEPAGPLPFEAVHSRLRKRLIDERRSAHFERRLAELRRLYGAPADSL